MSGSTPSPDTQKPTPLDLDAIRKRLTDKATNYRSWRRDMAAPVSEIERLRGIVESVQCAVEEAWCYDLGKQAHKDSIDVAVNGVLADILGALGTQIREHGERPEPAEWR